MVLPLEGAVLSWPRLGLRRPWLELRGTFLLGVAVLGLGGSLVFLGVAVLGGSLVGGLVEGYVGTVVVHPWGVASVAVLVFFGGWAFVGAVALFVGVKFSLIFFNLDEYLYRLGDDCVLLVGVSLDDDFSRVSEFFLHWLERLARRPRRPDLTKLLRRPKRQHSNLSSQGHTKLYISVNILYYHLLVLFVSLSL